MTVKMNQHSFAVLAYKNSPFLASCLDSLKNQTIKSTIYISTSTPSEYISNLADKYGVEVFVTTSGKGAVHDNNAALQHANTQYVTLAHQDDVYLPGYTTTCLAAAEKFNDTLICFTNYSEMIDGQDRPVTLMLAVKRCILSVFMPFKRHLKSRFWKTVMLAFGNPIALPSVMYNRQNLPGFQFPPELAHNVNTIDWQIWSNMAKMNGRFVYVKDIQLKRRIHSASLSSIGIENNSRYNEDLMMFRKFWPDVIATLLAKIYSQSYKSNKTN